MVRKLCGCFLAAALCLLMLGSCATQKMTPMELGIHSFDAQEYEAAKTQFETVLAAEAENPQAVYYLGRIALQTGKLDEAVEQLEKAVSLEDTNSGYHFWLGVAYAQRIQEAPMLEKGQLAPKLKAEFERAVELDGNNIEARMGLAQYYLNAPPFMGGSATKAMEQVEAIKTIDPLKGHLFMAQIHSAKKEYAEAEAELRAAINLEPKNPDVYFQLGMLHQTAEDYPAAFEVFEKTIDIDPKYMSAMYQIGRTAIFAGENLDRGVECLNLYLKTEPGQGQPSWAHAHWRLGMIYEKMGDKEMAKKEYEAALELDPGNKAVKEALEKL